MTDIQTKLEIFDRIATRRNERRGFLRFAGGWRRIAARRMRQ
jgi:hypothetical protein